MAKHSAFITIPRPVGSASMRIPSAERKRLRCYMTASQTRVVVEAARQCGCTQTEFLRQLALNAATVLGVRGHDGG